MGQIFQDNIPPLVKASTTTLTFASTNQGLPSRVQVGGQSYLIPNGGLTLDLAVSGVGGLDTGSIAAVTLYYVYLVVNQSSYVPYLVASLAAPSVGPFLSGTYGTAEKLVGAFYTNGSSQVGSVVQIVGSIDTEWMAFTPIISWSTNYTGLAAFFKRQGDMMGINLGITLTGAPSESGGYFTATIPGGLTADTNKLSSGGSGRHAFNSGSYYDSAVGTIPGFCAVADYGAGNSKVTLAVIRSAAASTNDARFVSQTNNIPKAGLANGDSMSFSCFFPISGWKATLL